MDEKNNTVTSELGIPHDLILENQDGNWKIAHDAYDESYITKVKSPDFKEPNVDNTVISTDLQVNASSIPSSIVVPRSIATYNRNAAANYAETYWSGYNTYYYNYNELLFINGYIILSNIIFYLK